MPQRSRPLAAGMSVARTRNRLVLPLPFAPVRSRAPPASKRNDSPAKTKRSPRRQPRPSATRSGLVKALGGQKGGSDGGKPEPRGHGRIARPSTRFGGQTCKDQPYTYNIGTRLGLRFEKIVTFR